MNITAAAIRNSRVTIVALIAVMLAGLLAIKDISRAEDPGFTIRVAQVVTVFPGASPARVEQLVTDKLEKAIQEMPELNRVESWSRSGLSLVLVHIKESYSDMRPIWDSLRRKIDRVQNDLPEDAWPSQVNDEFGDVFGVVLSVTGEGFSYRELKEVADQVRDEFLLLDLVAKVDIYGAQEERLFVEYDNAKLSELGISPAQLVEILGSRNIIIPGGNVTTGLERIVLEPSGNFESVEDLRRSLINIPGSGDVVALEDIAHVERAYIDPPNAKMSASGQPALGLAISMREGGNITTLGTQVKAKRDELIAQYPIGIELDLLAFQPQEVNRIIEGFGQNLMQAVAIVTIVMLLALGLRTGLVVSTLIPMAMLMSLATMHALDIGLDQVSLAALIIALGMLVDNAIVISENTLVQMELGDDPLTAAVDSANKLRIPLLTASLSTAAAFFPIYLAESLTGEYMKPLFTVLTITLISSWLLSLTMIPLLSVKFLRVKQAASKPLDERPIYRAYRSVLSTMLRFRWMSLAATVVVFFVVIQGFSKLPTIFFPDADKPFLRVEFEMPWGTSIERSEQIVAEFETYIENELKVDWINDNSGRPVDMGNNYQEGWDQGVTSWGAFIGSSGPRFVLQHNPQPNRSHYSFMILNTTGDDINDEVIASLKNHTATNYPDLRISVKRVEYGPPVTNPVEIRISGRELDRLFEVVRSVKQKLGSIPGAVSVDDNWGARTKKLRIEIDPARAQVAGLSNRDIAISLQSALSGIELTQFREGDKIIPITLRSSSADRQDLGKLETLNVYSQRSGKSVPLTQVADVTIEWQPAEIIRRDRLKTVTVSSGVEGVTAAEVNAVLEPWLNEQQKTWGVGYRWEFGGAAESSSESNEAIAKKMPIGLAIILLLLVAQFNSIRRTVIVLTTIPLALIGVVIGLLVAKSFVGFMTTLGIISLVGIVMNNAIVLLERIDEEREDESISGIEAIIRACQRRFRPILVTTATTVLGMVPLWLGGGLMWEPMAISIIFGLLFSTVLTLGVIPVLYATLFRIREDTV